MKTLDRNRPFGEAIGAARYAFEQDGAFFNNQGSQVNEDGSPFEAKAKAKETAISPETGEPIKKTKPAKKTAPVDPLVPYERKDDANMKQLRARYTHVTGGKKLKVGTTLHVARQMIVEAIAEAAQS